MTTAAEAMRKRLLDAGFGEKDVVVLGPNDRKGNMVARYRGKAGSAKKPVLIIGHIDGGRRGERTGRQIRLCSRRRTTTSYGRGTQDAEGLGSCAVVTFLRMKREGLFRQGRSIILALTADEEEELERCELAVEESSRADRCRVALNPDAGGVEHGKGQAGELRCRGDGGLYADFRLTVTNPGGHSSLPTKDNAIYHLAGRWRDWRCTDFLWS